MPDLWAGTPAGQTVLLDHPAPGFTALDVTAAGVVAQPALSRLLPPEVPSNVDRRVYHPVQQASVLLAKRTRVDEASHLLIEANRRLGVKEAVPRSLAELLGWLSQPRPSLLERTVRRILPTGDRAPVEVVRAARKGPSPAWEILERRYDVWALAPAVEHALAILDSPEPSSMLRVHRVLTDPRPSRLQTFPRERAIERLLTVSESPPGEPMPERVAHIEPVRQLMAYAADFLDGNSLGDVL